MNEFDNFYCFKQKQEKLTEQKLVVLDVKSLNHFIKNFLPLKKKESLNNVIISQIF